MTGRAPASDRPAKGASSHGPPCTLGPDGGPCVRCAGYEPGNEYAFEKGNSAAVAHSAYAVLGLTPRAEALTARLRADAGDLLTGADEAALAVAALSAIQLSCATGALEEVTAAIERGEDVDLWLGRLESRARLSQDARRWSDTVRRWFDQLGLTPVGAAQLEAARQPAGIPPHEVAEFARVVLQAAIEFVDHARRDAFLEHFDRLVAPVIGELSALKEREDDRGAEK